MILSDKKKFIFIHIPKTGGTSIKASLMKFATISSYQEYVINEKPQKNKKFSKHAKAKDIFPFINNKLWKGYFKFAFVRNPWDWLVSGYFFTKRYTRDPRHNLCKKMVFKDFIEWFILKSKENYPSKFGQLDWLCNTNGKVIVDFIGRFENISNDFRTICKKLKITSNLKAINKSSHKHYRTYYDIYTKDLVYRFYKKDIDYFGYKF